MRAAVLIAILAFVAVAEASRADTLRLRSLLTYDDDDDHKREHEKEHEKEPMYCKDHVHHGDCPEYYECVALEKKACKRERVCKKNAYGHDDCTYDDVCWDYHCVEKPRYCDPHAKYDECEKQYGYEWQCKKIDKVCTYKDECKQVRGKCKVYDYEDKCEYIKGGCKAYNTKKVCKTRNVCVEYEQKKECKKNKVCKYYEEIKDCRNKCDKYDAYGNCVQYGKDCTTKKGPCREYEYKEHDCHYVPTDKCKKYKTEEHDCHYVNTTCKEYKQEKKCHKVHKGCKTYDYKKECHKVEDKCWEGKCVKKPPPPPPKPKYTPSPKYYGG